MNSGFRIPLLLILSALLTNCSNSGFKTKTDYNAVRKLAYDDSSVDKLSGMDQNYYEELEKEAKTRGHRLEFPPGFSDNDKTLMWHMSEGSEIYPLLWLVNLKSAKSNNKGSKFLDGLDKKFGIIPDYLASKSGYPIKWIGMTAAWSEEHPENQDIILKDNETLASLPRVRKLPSGKSSIAMSGVNCTFCHTASVDFIDGDNKLHSSVIEGAPAMIDTRGYFSDLFASTVKVMADKESMLEFLTALGVPDREKIAHDFTEEFKTAIGAQPTLKSNIVGVLEKSYLIGDKISAKKAKEVKALVFEHREEIYKHLIKLLKITYGFDTVPEVLDLRMRYFAKLGTTTPALEETDAGYGRTDAFGRISNEVARDLNPISLTAPVSMPYMYGIKYKAMFHYNANTNSVISRNIGQSFGLGAIRTSPNDTGAKKFESTSNLHNLITMEKILYKAKVPEFQEIFPTVKIDKVAAVKGCNIYQNKCMGCHDADSNRVGPKKALINYKVIPLDVIGTDGIYIRNQATPIKGKPFRKGIFDFTDGVKDWYFKEYNIGDDEVKMWANANIRGVEIFRDTINGEDRFADDPSMNYVTIEKGRGYVSKNLAGIWATAPYLHNGSVPNVYELLLPSVKRSKIFTVGNKTLDNVKMGFLSDAKAHPDYEESWAQSIEKLCEYDPTNCLDTKKRGNSNVGHEPSMYGGELKHEEKMQLIEFLKVVRPESEYAWTSTPLYKIENKKCEIR